MRDAEAWQRETAVAREPQPLDEKFIFTAEQMRKHINGKKWHQGTTDEEPHVHYPMGKYVFRLVTVER